MSRKEDSEWVGKIRGRDAICVVEDNPRIALHSTKETDELMFTIVIFQSD